MWYHTTTIGDIMNLDLNFSIKNLEGKEIEKAGKLVADILAGPSIQGFTPIKAYDFAVKLFSEGKIEIDRADLTILGKAITDSQLFNFAKAQILEVIEKVAE